MSYNNKRKQVDLLQQKINSHGTLSAEVKKKVNYKFRLDWNYYSNSMEGNTLTMDETRSVMIGNLTVGGKPIKDVMEIHGHDEVISKIIQIGKGEVRLSEARIKEIHSAIMHEDDLKKKNKIGQWKTSSNHVINYKGEKFDFASPADVADKIHALLNTTNAGIDAIINKKKNAPHPLDIALKFHLEYITIHPFYDGNGRTGRILTNLLLISFGYPPIIIKTDDKDAYYQYLADIQAYGGDPSLLFDFMAGLLLRSQQLVLDAIAGKEIEEPDDIDKRVAILNRALEGRNEVIQKTKNKEVMKQMLKEVVKPLFRKVFEKILKISPLFTSTEFNYYIDGGGGPHHNINELIENIEIGWEQKKGDIWKINLNVYLAKLKKLGTKAFDMSDEIRIDFEKHKYQIVFNQNKIAEERLYHQMLSPEEINEVATRFVNSIFTRIEEQVKNRTK